MKLLIEELAMFLNVWADPNKAIKELGWQANKSISDMINGFVEVAKK